MTTFSHLWQYLAELFLEWEMFQIEVVDKIEIYILSSVIFSENRTVYEMMSKNNEGASEVADDNMAAHFMLDL